MQGIEKSFHSVQVLYGIDFTLEAGKVHALMGENGAGKSTLMKILAGIYRRDKGIMKMKGTDVEITTPKQAQEMGIAMIHQELSPIPEMTVAENIYLGREPRKGPFVDYNKMYEQTQELLDNLKVAINPKEKIGRLRVADQQSIEIAKAISLNAEIIIMDEPTSAISDKEVEALFQMIEDLKKKGKGIIYISHKMDEIFQIADDITVLRDGHYVNTWKAKDINNDILIQNMVGRELTEYFPKEKVPIKDVVIEVRNFSKKGEFQDINFEVRGGEILGLAGLVGAGRSELMHAIFGLERADTGEIYLNNQKVTIKAPKDAIAQGIAYVTEDRKLEGLVLDMSVGQNITLPSMRKMSKRGFIHSLKEQNVIREEIESLRIKTRTPRQLVKKLSGGNQQKVVLAKWLIKKPKVLILDEPTRGIDVGAKSEIYKLMCQYAGQGNAVIMISSEMPEVMGMSDRILVLSNGKMGGVLERKEFTQEVIMGMAVSHI